jgi:NADH dehydrogenase
VQGSDAVINLVGAFGDMQAVQADGAGHVAAAARAAGARALVHVSAIGADANSASAYGRSKGDGEAAVRTAFADAAILRPSTLFGREDQFINRFATMMRMAPVIPVIAPKAKFQPVYVGDVADAVVAALGDGPAGKTFELGGPQVLTMAELLRWIADATSRSPLFVDVPDFVASALASGFGWAPGAPITKDQWLMLQRDNVVADKAAGLAELGIAPTSLGSVADGWLVQYRRNGRFAELASR